MRITYVTHTRFPTEKAHGNQVAQVCHALAMLGHEVTLLAPTVRNEISEEPHAYYGLPRSFQVVYPGSFDALGSSWVPGKWSFAVSMWSYRRSLSRYLRDHPSDLLYARSPSLLDPLLRIQTPVLMELHTLPRIGRRSFARQLNKCFRVVCLTSHMRSALLSSGADPLRVTVEPDAVDLERFASRVPSSEAKKRWNLPSDRPVIGYVGSLVTQNTIEKGVGELVAALVRLKRDGVRVFGFIVGGPSFWRQHYEDRAREGGLIDGDIRFLDRIPPIYVPSAIAACDICVYPAPSSTHPFFLRDTSPLKLFEYLAAGKPIVCADLPPLHDVVDAKIVRFCAPGDPESLANGIRYVLEHADEAKEFASAGRDIAEEHSWMARMQRIIGGLGEE